MGSPRPRPEDEPGVGAAAGAAASRRSCLDVEGSAGGRACARRGDRGAAGPGVLLAAILAQSLGQEVVGASLTVSWRKTRGLDLDSLGSSLARAVPTADELVHHRCVDVLALRTRQAVRLRTRQMATVPGSTQRRGWRCINCSCRWPIRTGWQSSPPRPDSSGCLPQWGTLPRTSRRASGQAMPWDSARNSFVST